MCSFDVHTHPDMVIIIRLINISITSYRVSFLCENKTYSLRKFQICITPLLTLATRLYFGSPELMHLIIESWDLESNIS